MANAYNTGDLVVPPAKKRVVGKYYAHPSGVITTVTTTNQRLYLIPFKVEVGHSVDRLSVHATGTPGGTGSVVRLGIYNDNAGTPGSLLLDAGTVATTSTGAKEITVAQALAVGTYWGAVVSQGTPSPNPTFDALTSTGSNDSAIPLNAVTDLYAACLIQASVTAGLPDPAVPSDVTYQPPLLYMRIA